MHKSFNNVLFRLVGQFFSLEIAAEVKKLVKTVDNKVLLKEFIGVFKEPKTLPSLEGLIIKFH